MSEFTGKKLKEARVKKGLSQDEAANLMNVAKRAISETKYDIDQFLKSDEEQKKERVRKHNITR